MASHPLLADHLEFPTVLRRRLDNYFVDRGASKRGTPLMTAKIVLGLTASAATYAALYVFPMNGWQFLLAYVFHGLTQLFLLLNIAHDGNHNSISGNRYLNKMLSCVFDVFGINSYMWRILHNAGHHSNINVAGDDEDVLARGFLRFSPLVPLRPVHRYQHIYCWIVYGLSTFDYVLLKDFIYFFFSSYRLTSRVRHPFREYAALFAWKLFYYTYMIVLPIVILRRSPLLVLAAFVAAHFAMGILAQFVFQTTHVIETSYFPKGKTEFDNYIYHVLATTADYSTEGKLPLWFMGGLNHHVVHHLCPGVCHTHYPALTEIVKETAAEYHVPYRAHRTIWQALARHFLLLKRLGSEA